ncbi:MAG: phosphatase PAP2 family protein [Chthoniobacterales bacterium]|nr:phosphatase PAP2 family protein [Chthoniobacterales bacterium]
MNPLKHSLYLILVSILLPTTPLVAHQDKNSTITFLDPSSLTTALTVTKILPPPPAEGSQNLITDQDARTEVAAAATKTEIKAAKHTEYDVFSFSDILGPRFNAQELPKTAAFFKKIDGDTHGAIHIAKKTFERPRPMKTTGYDYPSGHSTLSFVWESLLVDIFPERQKELYAQAKTMAWNRVVLGHHYPSDIAAGETYGRYLAQEFLKNPHCQQELDGVKEELKKHLIPSSTMASYQPSKRTSLHKNIID